MYKRVYEIEYMDLSTIINIIIIPTLLSSAAGLSIPIIAITILMALQRKSGIRGFRFFMMGFFSQIVSTIISVILRIAPYLIFKDIPPIEVITAVYTISTGVSIFLGSLLYISLSLGFLSVLCYKVQVNGLAITSAVLGVLSLFVPWFAVGGNLVAPTYTFPSGTYIDSVRQGLLQVIIVTLLTITTYCFIIGSVFSGRIGRVLILVGGIIAFSSPFTYFLISDSVSPWIGMVMPFITTLISYFALQHHPKELERMVPDLTGLTT